MKPILFLIVLNFFLSDFSIINAQSAANNAVYATGELNLSTYFGMDLNLNYVLKEKYSFKLGYSGNFRNPVSQPGDFTTGVKGILLFGLNSPVDRFENFGASIGRVYKLNQSGGIRVNFSLGLGYTLYTEPDNWVKVNDHPVSLKENYTYDYAKHNVVSLIINPKIEFPFTRYFGFTLSPMLLLNKDRPILASVSAA